MSIGFLRGGRRQGSADLVAPHRLTLLITVALIVGIAFGYTCHTAIPEAADRAQVAEYCSVVSDIFLRLIQMIVAPLVLSTLIAGIAKMGNGTSLGRIAVRTLAWFLGASVVSLLLGIVMVNWLAPGEGLALQLPSADAAAVQTGTRRDLGTFMVHVVPRSIFAALATNEILQIVVFALFAGTALAAIGPRGEALVHFVDSVVELMLKITSYVMRAAPIAVFASIAAAIIVHGTGILAIYGKFVSGFYLALLLLVALLTFAGYVVLGRSVVTVLRATREPLLLAFATASSEAAYPQTLARLEQIGVPARIAGFVLPLGYSFNLDGSMMFCAFALMFIAQVHGVDLTIAQQAAMLLLLMVTSKGMAGVPRASLVVVAAALPQLGLPEAGLLLLLGVDQFMDMGRTAINVVGNSIATAAVARWEGVRVSSEPPDVSKRDNVPSCSSGLTVGSAEPPDTIKPGAIS
jgi:Na+/H+-dicarboxylate symporter